MTGYTRQSSGSIVASAEITASPLNAEFDQLQSAFNSASGHAHDGSTGNGPRISLTSSVSGILPLANGGTGLATTSAFIQTLLDDADAATARTTLSAVGLTNTETVTGLKTITLGNSTTTGDYLIFRPTDYAAGKPELAINKSVNATQWNFNLYDTVGNTGTINFNSSILTKQGISIVDLSSTQTLTNKTLTSPAISSPTLTGTLTGGTVNPTTLQVGSQAVSMVKIGSVTGSGTASLSFTSIPSSGYSYYILRLEDIVTSLAANTDVIVLHVSTDNGSTWKTTSGDYIKSSTTSKTWLSSIAVSGNLSTFKHQEAEIRLYGLGNSSRATMAKTMFQANWPNTTQLDNVAADDAGRTAAEADNAIRFTSNGGANITSGTITLYGVLA